MALVNAFGDIALDESVQELIAQVVAIAVEQAIRQSMQAPRALQYARTPTDAMRVSVENTVPVSSINTGMWNNGNYVTWYASGGPVSMDARQQQMELSMQTFNAVRMNRWVFS